MVPKDQLNHAKVLTKAQRALVRVFLWSIIVLWENLQQNIKYIIFLKPFVIHQAHLVDREHNTLVDTFGLQRTFGRANTPGSTLIAADDTPTMCLSWLVNTWTAAPVVYPLTSGSDRKVVIKPSRNSPNISYNIKLDMSCVLHTKGVIVSLSTVTSMCSIQSASCDHSNHNSTSCDHNNINNHSITWSQY